jgi:hypothetical protein
MPAMTEEQADRTLRILAELYADQYGMENVTINVEKKR